MRIAKPRNCTQKHQHVARVTQRVYLFKFSKCPFHLGLGAVTLTQSHRRCKMRNINANTIFKPKISTAKRDKNLCFSSLVWPSLGLTTYITKISVCVCVFWPPGELEKADGKAAIGPWQRCYQPDERLPKPSFDKQITERGLGFSVNRPSRLN